MPLGLEVKIQALLWANMKGNNMNLNYDYEMFKSTFENDFTWLNGFMRNVNRFSKKTAMIEPLTDQSWSYKELNQACNMLANSFKKSGVKKSDVVLMQLFNTPQFVFGYIASHKTGAVCNPVNYNISPGETVEIIEHNKPKIYMYDAEIIDKVLCVLEISRFKPDVIIAVNSSNIDFELPEGHILYEDYIKDNSDENPVVDFEPFIYDETLRLQTSGTTGTPKGVPLNNINEIMSAHNIIMDLGVSRNDITMNMTPWFHRGGIHSTGPTTTFYCGGTVVIMRKFNPKLCVKYIEEYKITYLTGVPAVLIALCNRLEKHTANMSTLKGILAMGSPLEREACIRFQNVLTPNIYNGYGTTESLWNIVLTPEDLPEMAGYTGVSNTDDEVRVVKIYDGKKAEPEDLVATNEKEEGEVIIKCPAKSCYCYANNPETTSEKFYKGWLYTGDVAIWNEDLYIKVVGRKDDMIISKGENIYPARVEEAINCHPKVADCIVTGVPDKARGEAVVAYVVPEDKSLTVAEIMSYCSKSKSIAKHQIPRYYRFVDSLPMTATGKKQNYIMKKQAKDDLLQGLLSKK